MSRRSDFSKLKVFMVSTGSILLMSFLGAKVFASLDGAANKGLDIAKKLDAIDDNFKDQSATMKMILTDRHGRTSTREILSKTLEVPGDGDKSLISFEGPRTVKGTRFLSFTHKSGPDDQWLYLPKIKRVKRIASNNKAGPFMASEFAYEDIASQEVEKYTYKFIREEKVDGKDHYVIERYPVDKKSGYSKQLVWIVKDPAEMRVRKIDFYDVKKAHLKTLNFEGYEKYNDRYWRPKYMKMTNHVTGKKTTLEWSNYKLTSGLNERDFDINSLKRAR